MYGRNKNEQFDPEVIHWHFRVVLGSTILGHVMQHFCNWLPNAGANACGNLMKTHN